MAASLLGKSSCSSKNPFTADSPNLANLAFSISGKVPPASSNPLYFSSCNGSVIDIISLPAITGSNVLIFFNCSGIINLAAFVATEDDKLFL